MLFYESDLQEKAWETVTDQHHDNAHLHMADFTMMTLEILGT
jgi:hypothetical protein